MLGLGRKWLLDLLGFADAATETSMSRIVRDDVVRHFSSRECEVPILFDGRPASPGGAALEGDMTIDALDSQDGHKLTKGHVGCGVLPGLLSFTQAEALKDDRVFLAALVLGYEIGTRTGIALQRTACDYHTSGAWIAIAAAALGARCLGLDSVKSHEAIGVAEYDGPCTQMMRVIDHPTMLKDGSGWGATAGVSAAYLAADGFTGAPAVTVESAEVHDLWEDLGQRWRIAEQFFEHYPIRRWAQPPVQAVLDLRKAHNLRSNDVERIEITTYHQSLWLAARAPIPIEGAQYSTAYPTAVAMVRGHVAHADVMEQTFPDGELKCLAAGMTVVESDTYNAAFPGNRISSVTLFLRNRAVLTSGDTEVLGDPENPASEGEVKAKFCAYAEPKLGQHRRDALEVAVDNLGLGSGLQDFHRLIFQPIAH